MLGVFECGSGAAALWLGGRAPAVLVAGLYAGFAAFLVALLRAGDASSCGCVGERDVAPTWTHVGIDLVAAVAAIGAALSGVGGVPTMVRTAPLRGFGLLVAAAAMAYGAFLAVTELPAALAASRSAADAGPRPSRAPRFSIRTTS
jgi:hypothetical protein